MSQLDLAGEAEISTRHLSFVETGRSAPSREMVLRLAERLDVPLRERNALLVAAGYAPMYRERPLDDPALAAAREAVELISRPRALPGAGGRPALELLAHNAMLPHCSRASAPPAAAAGERAAPEPAPAGPRAAHRQPGQWRTHLFERLRQQIQATGDARCRTCCGNCAGTRRRGRGRHTARRRSARRRGAAAVAQKAAC